MNIILKKIFSLIILICISPLFLIVILAIILDDGFPVFFQQRRIGINNDKFWIYKFRTMKKDTPDIPTHLVHKSQNLNTFIGPTLRKLSIDELPQLINILKGEMGFIGPRPALHNQDDLIDLRTKAGVHTLAPGITGWAQVNGRDDLPIPQKVELDKYYLNHKSFILNIKILFMTVFQIIFPKGVSN
jgi:O-antigen biosynthesis protein WbqP